MSVFEPALPGERRRFWRIAGAGAAFQAGAAAIDTATIVASLVFQLTGSAFAVGFASAARTVGRKAPRDARSFLRDGWQVLKDDSRFRPFLYSQWLGGATLMALPFYVLAADASGVTQADVGLLLGAQVRVRFNLTPVDRQGPAQCRILWRRGRVPGSVHSNAARRSVRRIRPLSA